MRLNEPGGLAVRPATPADAALLAALHLTAFPEEPWPAQAMAALLDSPGVYGFLAPAETPEAFILCRSVADEAEILSLAVRPTVRRRGLGGQLLAVGLGWALALAAGKVFLEVAEDNVPALALYTQAGFVRVGRRPDYYQRGPTRIAALVLALSLDALKA